MAGRKAGKESMKEFETMVIMSGGESVPQSELADFNARNAAAMERYRMMKAAQPRAEFCPFSSAVNPVCRGDECALHVKEGCSLRVLFNRQSAQQTEGKRCPFSGRPCTTRCAMTANGGCVLTNI